MNQESLTVFVDSDVVISSLLSDRGAAHLLIYQTKIIKIVSDSSNQELEKVADRLRIDKKHLSELLSTKFTIVRINDSKSTHKAKFEKYVTDQNDLHIIAGTVESKAKFLLSYNIKHFNIDQIKKDFDVTILTPAKFLQYLRSLD